MNLDSIKNNTTWEDAATAINSNFSKTNLEVAKIASSSNKHKGFFTTEAALLVAQPYPRVGDNAYVGATYPGVVYVCNTTGVWNATTTVPSPPAVNISEYYKKTETDTIIDTVEANMASLETDLNGKVPVSRRINLKPLTADINLTKSDIGLGNADNTADTNKPVSSAAQTALNLKTDKTIQIISGNGLIGGGDLSLDRTISIVSGNDGIIANTDNIQLDTIDNLASVSTTKPLSANQGKILNGKAVQLETDLKDLRATIEGEDVVVNDTLISIGEAGYFNPNNRLYSVSKVSYTSLIFDISNKYGIIDLKSKLVTGNMYVASYFITNELVTSSGNIDSVLIDYLRSSVSLNPTIDLSTLVGYKYLYLTSATGSQLLSSAINTYSTTTNGVSESIESLNASITNINEEVSAINEEVSAINEEVSAINVEIDTLNSRIQNNLNIDITDNIYCIVGYQTNIYNDAISRSIDRGLSSPINYKIVWICDVGSVEERRFTVTPSVSAVGVHTLKCTLININGEEVLSKNINLIILNAVGLSSSKNILYIGDSLNSSGQVSKKIRDRFTAVGGITPSFVGTYGSELGNKYEARGGLKYSDYATKGRATYRASVTGVTSVIVGAVYSDSQYNKYKIAETNITDGYGDIKLGHASGTEDILTMPSGVLTKISGSGDGSINYTNAYYEGDGNNLWNYTTNQLDITNYRTNIGVNGYIDLVLIQLFVNDAGYKDSIASIDGYIASIYSAFISDNPNCKILLGIGCSCGNTINGVRTNGGAAYDVLSYLNYVYDYRQYILNNYQNNPDYPNLKVACIAPQLDRYFGYERGTYRISPYTTETEMAHINFVHPYDLGYNQMADAWFGECINALL